MWTLPNAKSKLTELCDLPVAGHGGAGVGDGEPDALELVMNLNVFIPLVLRTDKTQ